MDRLSPDGLRHWVARLLERGAGQKPVMAGLRAEIARLQGLQGRPRIKPGGMEKATEVKSGGVRVVRYRRERHGGARG